MSSLSSPEDRSRSRWLDVPSRSSFAPERTALGTSKIDCGPTTSVFPGPRSAGELRCDRRKARCRSRSERVHAVREGVEGVEARPRQLGAALVGVEGLVVVVHELRVRGRVDAAVRGRRCGAGARRYPRRVREQLGPELALSVMKTSAAAFRRATSRRKARSRLRRRLPRAREGRTSAAGAGSYRLAARHA